MTLHKAAASVLILTLLPLAAGCTSYYKVHDPTTGRDYYTTQLKEQKNGSTQLTDAKTGKKVTIQNTEVSKISQEEYDTARARAD
jgi:hypothetical protein